MDYKKNTSNFDREKEILFSQAVKAGKRIYYLDVKRSKRDEMFLSITESKKIVAENGDETQFNFEKHKIFIYKEDFSKFIDALSNAIRFIHENDGGDASAEDVPFTAAPAQAFEETAEEPQTNENGEDEAPLSDEIDIKIDF